MLAKRFSWCRNDGNSITKMVLWVTSEIHTACTCANTHLTNWLL